MTETLKTKFVDEMPDLPLMEEGVIYVSQPFDTAIHLCPCGCRHQVVTPFGAGAYAWKLTVNDDESITLHPSVGNRFKCKSHYWVRKGKIEWT